MQILTEMTPNPNAMKFITEGKVKNEGSATFRSKEEAEALPLTKALFETSANITEVYLNDNNITVTQNGDTSWESLEEKIRSILNEKLTEHDADFSSESGSQEGQQTEDTPEFQKVKQIIEEDVKPALQMHGGDVSVLSVIGKKVIISYQGACGSCPSAAMGTLYAIKGVLEEKFDPEVEVELG